MGGERWDAKAQKERRKSKTERQWSRESKDWEKQKSKATIIMLVYVLMRIGVFTGGNWSAHCITRWPWFTVCFLVRRPSTSLPL